MRTRERMTSLENCVSVGEERILEMTLMTRARITVPHRKTTTRLSQWQIRCHLVCGDATGCSKADAFGAFFLNTTIVLYREEHHSSESIKQDHKTRKENRYQGRSFYQKWSETERYRVIIQLTHLQFRHNDGCTEWFRFKNVLRVLIRQSLQLSASPNWT